MDVSLLRLSLTMIWRRCVSTVVTAMWQMRCEKFLYSAQFNLAVWRKSRASAQSVRHLLRLVVVKPSNDS